MRGIAGRLRRLETALSTVAQYFRVQCGYLKTPPLITANHAENGDRELARRRVV